MIGSVLFAHYHMLYFIVDSLSPSDRSRQPLKVPQLVPSRGLPGEVDVLERDGDGPEEHVLLEPVAVPYGRLEGLATDLVTGHTAILKLKERKKLPSLKNDFPITLNTFANDAGKIDGTLYSLTISMNDGWQFFLTTLVFLLVTFTGSGRR